MLNVDMPQDNLKTIKGIGLYKIHYEMEVADSKKDHQYVAGIVAYSSDEATQTLIKFARDNVKGFKGMRVNQVSFDGHCHELSDTVREQVLNKAKMEGVVVSKEDYDAALAEKKKQTKKKSNILSKDLKTKKE